MAKTCKTVFCLLDLNYGKYFNALCDLLPKYTRRSNDPTYLSYHPLEKLNYKNQNFRQIAPGLWNSLDKEIRESPNVDVFKVKLKTYYFKLLLSLSIYLNIYFF